MSRREPARAEKRRTRRGCENCIFGPVRWFVCYSYEDDLWEHEREICDRCMEQLRALAEEELAAIWWVEET